jgi:Tol biopolymer transport system component
MLQKHLFFALTISLAILFAEGSQFSTVSPTVAQEGTTSQDGSSTQIERPFQLPFVEPSSPNTWLMAQPYGNTTSAYRQRFTTYGASGGIHFGLDLSAPCGTEVVAIADGIVFAVDGPFGSPPHNLMIDHPQLGYASMYGHLLEAPKLVPGQKVKQGEVIALTGDSAGLCYRRPHLHLEIRDLDYHTRKYNPMPLIEANWNNLALIGSSGRDFTRDLNEPRKWQTLYTQPEVWTGGPIINDFANPWPFDWSQRATNSVTPASLVVSAFSETQPPSAVSLSALAIGRQITAGDCCTQPYWRKDSTQVRFIDQPGSAAPLGIWGVDLSQPESGPQLVTEQLGIYSPDGALIAYPDRNKGVAVIEQLADGQTWEIDTQERNLNFTPDSRHVIWTTYDEDAPRDTREESLWLANVDGSNVRAVFRAQQTNPVAWLSDNELLMTRRFPKTSDIQLFTLSIEDGRQTELTTESRMRGMALSPDKRHLVYYASFEPEVDRNGVWLIDLQNPDQSPQKLPFFGTYRWRNNQHLIYVPLDPEAISHQFYEYNILTKETQPLFPEGTNLTIANNDWQVSPDGRKIALVAAKGMVLDGIWVLDIDQD